MKRKMNEYGIPEPIISKDENVSSTVERAFTTKEVSELLSISTEVLKAMRDENYGPKYDVIDGRQGELALYTASDLTDWLRKRDGKCAQEKGKSDEL